LVTRVGVRAARLKLSGNPRCPVEPDKRHFPDKNSRGQELARTRTRADKNSRDETRCEPKSAICLTAPLYDDMTVHEYFSSAARLRNVLVKAHLLGPQLG